MSALPAHFPRSTRACRQLSVSKSSWTCWLGYWLIEDEAELTVGSSASVVFAEESEELLVARSCQVAPWSTEINTRALSRISSIVPAAFWVSSR